MISRHQGAIADNADKRANQRLSGGIQRGQSGHLTGGRAGQTQGRQSRVPPRCRQSRRGTGERHERHDEQYAGEDRQHHVRLAYCAQSCWSLICRFHAATVPGAQVDLSIRHFSVWSAKPAR